MMRMDIMEGSEERDMPPRLGWGRILTAQWLTEQYFTVRILGRRLFIVKCHATWPKDYRYWRWWFR